MLISYNQLEDICEGIRDNLINHSVSFTSDDLVLLEFIITSVRVHPHIVPIVRILECMELTDTVHNEFINRIIPPLLHSIYPGARYAALDLITSRCGEQYSALVFAAKIALKDDPVEYIKEYIDSLINIP